MSYGNNEELLEWDMEIDQNFEDALDREAQDFNRKLTAPQQRGSKTSASLWSTRSQDYEKEKNLAATEHRKSGDGDSITSHDMVGTTRESYPGSTLKDIKDQNDANSFSDFSRSYDQTGRKGFTILDEDDADIISYDISPMEFRGTLKTGNPPHKPETSCCCVLLQFITVAMLSLAIGVVIGYYMGTSNILEINVTDPKTTTSMTPTRDVFNNTMVSVVNQTEVETIFTSEVAAATNNSSI